jgi:hypothetical protein
VLVRASRSSSTVLRIVNNPINSQSISQYISNTPSMFQDNVASPAGEMAMPSSKDYTDLHELAKGWKAAIARAKDPATK